MALKSAMSALYKVEFPPYDIDYIEIGRYVPGAGRLSDKRFHFRKR